jgi:glycosyltransferase involved in cell wall biosynthesis
MSGQKVIIHQFHPNVAFGDAITQQMFLIRESLHRAGIGGEIFAREWKGVSRASVRPFSRAEMWNADLLLVHHSSGHPGMEEIRALEVPKALVYHNITPPDFFRHDPYLAGLCRLGREQLVQWRDHVVAAFADSRFNADELVALGYRKPELLPLLDLSTMAVSSRPAKRSPGTLLFVGRLSVHKNQAGLIAALFYLRRSTNRPYRLVLAGGGDPVYREYLVLLAKQLGLESEVEFVGKVSHGDLAALYRRSDAYVSLSLHEGFGVPLVEAMQFQVPVFALPRGAVAETLGPAGVRLPSERPSEMAAFLEAALGDPEWEANREKILAGQTERLEQLGREQTGDVIPTRLRRHVRDLRRGPRPSPKPEKKSEAGPSPVN